MKKQISLLRAGANLVTLAVLCLAFSAAVLSLSAVARAAEQATEQAVATADTQSAPDVPNVPVLAVAPALSDASSPASAPDSAAPALRPNLLVPGVTDVIAETEKFELPVVLFDHVRHSNSSGSLRCTLCHRPPIPEEQRWDWSLQTASIVSHAEVTAEAAPEDTAAAATLPEAAENVPNTTPATAAAGLKEYYHDRCISCHEDIASAGKVFPPGLSECRTCHTADIHAATQADAQTEQQPDQQTDQQADSQLATQSGQQAGRLALLAGQIKLEAEMLPDLHDRHIASGRITAILAENAQEYAEYGVNCGVCHHTYDAGAGTLLPDYQPAEGCRACHSEKATKNPDNPNSVIPAYKTVAHAACISCHFAIMHNEKLVASPHAVSLPIISVKPGYLPMACGDCHNAASF